MLNVQVDNYSLPVTEPGYEALVQAKSRLLGKLARDIAREILARHSKRAGEEMSSQPPPG